MFQTPTCSSSSAWACQQRRQDSVRDVRQTQYMYYILCSYRNTAATHQGYGTRQGEVFEGPYRHTLTSTVINDKMCSEMQGMDHQGKAGKLHQQNSGNS